MNQSTINTAKFSEVLRNRGVRPADRQILITRFAGSEQEKDLSNPANCGGWGRIHHFLRSQGDGWPDNPLPLDPAAKALGLPMLNMMEAQVFQNAICSWRCWYCFVDYSLLSGDLTKSDFKTCAELVDLYAAEEVLAPVIDLSGGQPDLVPEWALWFADEITRRSMETSVYLWSDDNLSNDYLWRFLDTEKRNRLASFKNYGRVGCFKGFDARSFAFNTGAEEAMFETQFHTMRRLVEAGLDVYGYVTLTSTDDAHMTRRMCEFVDRLQSEVHPRFPLRMVPLRIAEFTPTRARMRAEYARAMEIQQIAVRAWQEELEARFSKDDRRKRIFEHELN
jgi:uncharacterized Fe-S cluster-containing radical SAM superfamily protein